jgi:hypothetical protein
MAKQSGNSKKEKGPLNSQRAIRVNYRRLTDTWADARATVATGLPRRKLLAVTAFARVYR